MYASLGELIGGDEPADRATTQAASMALIGYGLRVMAAGAEGLPARRFVSEMIMGRTTV